MYKRPAIYIRTSSEHQGAKASPAEQEADCRKLAEDNGLVVETAYRHTERYRVKNRLVDPSGTRADRSGLVAMLEDAREDCFDVILAWREDRLYRGPRAMLLVLETIQECKIDILLAKENFDQKMAPLKAWLAQMELDGMRERMNKGV
jgi:DNA invertase Pin-like site-specific DNA recombinase